VSEVEIVNPVPVDDIEAWFTSMVTTFLDDPSDIASQLPGRALSWDADRAWGARADGRWVATLRTEARDLSVPGAGAGLPTDALTNVTVSATHRRQGLLSSMLTHSLAAAKDRGEAVSALIAAEWPIYGRFGYAPCSDFADYDVHTREPGSRLVGESSGRVRQVEADELGAIAPAVFERARQLRAGNIDRPSYWWTRTLGLNDIAPVDKRPVVHIVHEGASGIDGYVSWHSTGDWSLTGRLGEITVSDLVATDGAAYHALWQYLLGIDVADRVHLRDRPVDEPLRWLLVDGRVLRLTHRLDRIWLRILDVPTTLAARTYSCAGAVVLDVIDPDGGGYAAGRFLLEAGPDGAHCQPTKRPADLEIHHRALAAIYFGGHTLASQIVAGLVTELRPGALAQTAAMFSTAVAPWCATSF
jgi:predicted acetyltransferase